MVFIQRVFLISKNSPRISKNELPVSSPDGQCANHPDAPVHVAIGKRNNERPKHLSAMFSQLTTVERGHYPYHPFMVYLPTFTIKNQPSAGRYNIPYMDLLRRTTNLDLLIGCLQQVPKIIHPMVV